MKQKIEFRYVAAPLVSIIAFLILLGGASYAYYTQSVGGVGNPSNISNANLTVPRGCTFISNATNCVITGNTASTVAFTDAYISRGEMSYAYRGNNIAQSTCALNMGVQGQAGCRCTVQVNLVGTVYNYVNGSLKGQITSTNTSHSQSLQSINTLTNTITKLQVATTGTAVYENMSLTLKAFNVDADQSNQSNVSYVYYLRAIPMCTVENTQVTVTFDANGGSVSTTSKAVTVGERYDTLPTPTWSGHTFRGWNGKNKLWIYSASTTQNGLTVNSDNNVVHVYGTNTKTDANWGIVSWSSLRGRDLTVGNQYTLSLYKDIGQLYFANNYTNTSNTAAGLAYSSQAVYTFTVPSNYSKFAYSFLGVYKTAGFVNETFYVQLEEGAVSTPFEPYFVTEDTIVTLDHNHTLTAIWD